MADQEPLAEYKLGGFSITVYPNRIEEVVASFLAKKRTVIPLRNIAGVEKHLLTGRLTVKTNDGKKKVLNTGPATDRIYEAIMQAL